MKALFISNDPNLFDAQSAVRARMRIYAKEIGELHILSSAYSNAQEAHEEGLFLHPASASRLFRISTLTKKAHTLILQHNIEVVSAQDPFEHGLIALRAVSGTKAKLHIQVHTDFLSPWFIKSGSFWNRLRPHLADKVLPHASGVRVVSERVKKSLISHYGNSIKEPVVIPAAIDTYIPEAAPLPQNPFTFSLITVGRLEAEKRLEDILIAFKQALEHYSTIGLFIVGEGRKRKRLERMAYSLGIAKNVIFLGSRLDARGLMRSADVFIQASAYEGYSFTLIEAALADLPMISTDVGIVGEVFRKNVDILSIPIANPEALADAIGEVIRNEALRKQLSLGARISAQEHLNAIGNIPVRIAENLARTREQESNLSS